MPFSIHPTAKPGVVPNGRHVADPCLGRDVQPIAVAGTTSPNGRRWIALQHGSVGTTDDRTATWRWHCRVLTVDGHTVSPTGIVSWDESHALVWAPVASGGLVALQTNDAGATWSRAPVAGFLGADIASAATVVAWGEARGQTGAGPRLFRLTTSTAEWSVVKPEGLPGVPTSIAFVDDDHGWAFGPGWLASTDDGGASWGALPMPERPVTGIAPAEPGRGCVLHRIGVSCTEDSGAAWARDPNVTAFTHIAAITPVRTIAAGQGGQVRWFHNGKLASGTTIDYTAENQIRFLSAEWGQYVTTNSFDGHFAMEDGGFLGRFPLGEEIPDR